MKNIGLSLSGAILLVACSNGDDAQANGNASAEKQALSDISPVDRKPFETMGDDIPARRPDTGQRKSRDAAAG